MILICHWHLLASKHQNCSPLSLFPLWWWRCPWRPSVLLKCHEQVSQRSVDGGCSWASWPSWQHVSDHFHVDSWKSWPLPPHSIGWSYARKAILHQWFLRSQGWCLPVSGMFSIRLCFQPFTLVFPFIYPIIYYILILLKSIYFSSPVRTYLKKKSLGNLE